MKAGSFTIPMGSAVGKRTSITLGPSIILATMSTCIMIAANRPFEVVGSDGDSSRGQIGTLEIWGGFLSTCYYHILKSNIFNLRHKQEPWQF